MFRGRLGSNQGIQKQYWDFTPFFADDLILFGKASEKGRKLLKKCWIVFVVNRARKLVLISREYISHRMWKIV